MIFDIITIFPHIFQSYFNEAMLKRAQDKKLIKIKTHDLRDWTTNKHKTVDDTPYGGGAGMIMKVDVLHKALQKIKNQKSTCLPARQEIKIQNYGVRSAHEYLR